MPWPLLDSDPHWPKHKKPRVYVMYYCVFVPQVFDNYAVTVMIGGDPYTLSLFDISGQSNLTQSSKLFCSHSCAWYSVPTTSSYTALKGYILACQFG